MPHKRQANNHHVIVQGISYNSHASAYKELAPYHTKPELQSLLNVPGSYIASYKSYTGINYKEGPNNLNKGVGRSIEVVIKDKAYSTKQKAYIDLAPNNTISELSILLDSTPNSIKSMMQKTKVNYKGANEGTLIVINGQRFKSRTSAYKSLAPNYTKTELSDLLNTKPEYIKLLEKKTGISYEGS